MIFLQDLAGSVSKTTSIRSASTFGIDWLEYALVALLIGAQIWLLIQTILKIRIFRTLLFQPPILSVYNVEIATNVSSSDLNELPDLFTHFQQLEVERDKQVELGKVPDTGSFWGVELIGYAEGTNRVSLHILNTINRYLIKSQGQVADFVLIKDVVERQSDALEEEISLATPIPLYLGLLGTMLGVIIGVYNMSYFTNSAEAEQLGQGIAVLLSGVKVAMVASAVGLLATVILSLGFRGAKMRVEAQKNGFYSLIQCELLPLISESMASSIGNLQSNLMRFNNEFGQNLVGLNQVMESNERAILQQQEAIDAQRELAREIKEADLAKLANANVTIWRELKVGVGQLEQFNAYLHLLNGFFTSSQQLEGRMSELLNRTNQFGELYDRFVLNTEMNQELLRFLQSHFSELEKRKDLINQSLLHVDDAVSQGFGELRDHLKAKTDEFKSTLLKEEDLMSQALASNRTNLDNLRYLEDVSHQLQAINKRSIQQSNDLQERVTSLNQDVNGFRHLIEREINQNPLERMRNWFINAKSKNGVPGSENHD